MAAALAFMSYAALAAQSAFGPDSLRQIEHKYAGESFLLIMWEINCPPCREELGLLQTLRKTHPDINLVLIATDDISLQHEVNKILQSYGLQDIDTWMFADLNVERLRYSVDPEWFGELPRNYFYDVDSSRVGFSGKLTEEIMEEWLKGDD
jgi:hypothetical protein